MRVQPAVLLILSLFLLGAASASTGSTAEADKLPRLDKTGVVVPWEDFKKILEEIRRVEPPEPPQPPPVDFALSACEVTASITADEKQARVRMDFSLQVLNAERWVEVPVMSEGVALSYLRIDGKPANVYRKDGRHWIALRGEGRHAVSLEYFAPVNENRGSRVTYLRFPQAPVIALDLTVPRPQLSFHIDGAVVRSTERSNGSTRVLAAFQQARDASVTWFKQAELEEKETKLMGELRTLLTVGEGMLRGTTHAVYTIHGKGVDTFRIGLADDVTVLDVNAQGIDDWAVEPPGEDEGGPNERVLTVRLNHMAQGSYTFRFSFEKGLGDTTVETRLPDLRILGAIRDKGLIAVAAATNVEINPVGKLENATPIDPGELPAELISMAGQPVLYGFKYLNHPIRIELSIVKHDDLAVKRTIVESAHLFTYLSPEGKCITSARYRIKNNRKQYLELVLPEGGEGWGAYVDDAPVKAAQSDDGKILIPLRKAAPSATDELEPFDVELVYFQREPSGFWGQHQFLGPKLDVDAMEVQWHVFLPRDKRYSGFDGNLHPDDELNHIVYLEKAAYNLRSSEDLERLRKSGLKDKELDMLGGPREDAPATAGEHSAVAEDERRQQVERELGELKQRRSASVQRDPAAEPQVMGNVGADLSSFYRGAGRARGVLPVRFHIPVDGLRLSFTGRILTAAEPPTVSIRYWPAVWVLSNAAVFIISFVLAGAALLMIGSRRSLAVRLALAVPAVGGLMGLFVVLVDARAALGLGTVLAVLIYAAARYWTRARVAPTAAMLLAFALLAAPGSRATETPVSAPPHIPDLQGTEVTLSWQDFKILVEKTYVPPPVPPAPPTDAFLRSAEYRGVLERGLLTLRGTLTLEVLKKGWVRLPLVSQGTVIDFEGQGALLNRNGSGLEVLARGPRSYTLKMQMAFPAGDHPGENRLAIRLPDAPRNLLDLSTAVEFRDIEIENGVAYDAQQDRFFVSLTGGAFAVKYTLPFRQIEEAAGEEVKLEPRVQLNAYQLLSLGEGVVSGVLVHDYNVRVAEVSHFDIDLPDDIVVFDCVVDGLESWKILQRDGQRYLRTKLLAPMDGAVRVVVSFEGAYDADDGEVIVPRFPALDTERESGFVAVAAEGAEVDLRLSGKLLPADVSELPADVRAYGGNLISVFKYSGVPDRATVSVTEHDDAPVLTAIIETLNATAALLENGTEATWIDLTVKNNRKQFLRFSVPGEDVEVWSLLLDGEPAKPKRTGDDVLVPLPRGDDETASRISIVLLRKGPAARTFGRLEPYLPSFDVPVSEALWTVYLPADKKYVAGGGEFRPVVVTDPLMPGRSGGRSVRMLSDQSPTAPLDQVYSDATSEVLAEGQIRQEEAVAQQFKQKAASRKGALPVRIAIPGGVNQLPRVTVSRMLIVGDEPNTFSIRVYPPWIAWLLRLLQPVLLVAAGLLLGATLAGVLDRRHRLLGGVAGFLGLVPFGGLNPVAAFMILAVFTAITWTSVKILRRSETRLAS